MKKFVKKILRNLSPKEIAEELDELSTDDAADIIAELPQDKKNKCNFGIRRC